ncbi:MULTISPECIES: type II secretion system F family protein [Nocardioides]|uniref:Type II secretion system F family protein n=1 Tax=Nocardioides vastitatis TaxID=2568655 RepID=A0ABW0ZIS6_9ACTN|nr:type II secretion system F family protein [Nocardioides sp.]THJ12599.1 VWA domain-containing protein [Nocardioides sp.]
MAARRLFLLFAALVAAVLLPAAAASAEDGTITHVESSGEDLRVLVNVPPGVEVDLAGVSATLDGGSLNATASAAGTVSSVKRVTILAIDTSRSMARSGRFAAAKDAAGIYLDSVPRDVEVGVVTFDSEVAVALSPTTDRDAARAVINSLDLRRDTLLYDGVSAAVDAAGEDGQRTVLLLSDGSDTGGSATLDDVTGVIESTETLVDVVSLGQSGKALAPLRAMADAGNGRVIESTGPALAEAFRTQADLLAGQVLITAPLPSDFDAREATVEVILPTAGEPVVARALASIQEASSTDAVDVLPTLDSPAGWAVPGWLLYVGIGVSAIGLVSAAVLLVPRAPGPMTIAERVEAYSARTSGSAERSLAKPPTEPVMDQARAAAAGVLERNSGLNERLMRRLAAAGSEFKPSEWLLVHVAVVFGAGAVGLLLGKGSILVGLLFLVAGVFLPPIYLRFRTSRRRRAFDAALPEVLQLIAGALSAGLSLAQAIDTVVREGPEPIASEFKRVLVEARIGMPLEDAFEGVADRFQSKDFAWSVMAIRIQRQVGGNLAELLTTVASTMRERAYLRRQVRSLSAEGRLSAMILCGLPPVFALYLFLTNRSFLAPLVTDARGLVLSIGGSVWMLIGVFWMSRMVKVDV